MKRPIAIYGAGGLGRELLSVIQALPEWDCIGYFDDHIAVGTVIQKQYAVLGGLHDLLKYSSRLDIVLAFGLPESKMKRARQLSENKLIEFPVICHPSAILQDPSTIELGPGTIIAAGAILTTEISIGAGVIINLGCTIGHGVSIGSYSSLMPGVNIAGEVSMGEMVFVGSGVNVINQVDIGDHAIIGAGAVVNRSVPAKATAVGVPARVIKQG